MEIAEEVDEEEDKVANKIGHLRIAETGLHASSYLTTKIAEISMNLKTESCSKFGANSPKSLRTMVSCAWSIQFKFLGFHNFKKL